jgi:antitoxin component of RelBE/YafQ-DinJ toxin-antitoxin module
MAILSIRIDDKLKEFLNSEAQKEGISLSEYVKKSLESKNVDTHILATERNLKSSVASIENLAHVSQETVREVELNIQRLNESFQNANHLKELKKLKWILISISLIFVSISIPIFHFNIAYLKALF